MILIGSVESNGPSFEFATNHRARFISATAEKCSGLFVNRGNREEGCKVAAASSRRFSSTATALRLCVVTCGASHAYLFRDYTRMSKWIGVSSLRFFALSLGRRNPFIIVKLSGDRMLLRHFGVGVVGSSSPFSSCYPKPLAFIDWSDKTLLTFDYPLESVKGLAGEL